MNNFSLVVPALYFFIILGLCTYLLMRGITHAFVGWFAAAALIELLRSMALLLMNVAPGGLGAHTRYLPAASVIGYLGMLIFIVGFASLTRYLVVESRTRKSE